MKIIYLVESKFCKRDYDRFGLNILSKRGYSNIEIWDFSCWFRPEYFKTYKPKDLLLGANIISIPSKNIALNLLKKVPENSVFICFISINSDSVSVFNFLNINKYKYGFFSFGLMPIQHGFFLKLRREITGPFQALRRSVNIIFSRIKIRALTWPINPNFVILGGALAKNKFTNDKTKLIKAHTLDYDSFLTLKGFKRVKFREKYAVYLDEGSPYHPDSIGKATRAEASSYYATLNKFFKYIELKICIKIIIAPHPRANYNHIGNPFNGRNISNLPTYSLVRDSDFVMLHKSSSIAFAVLCQKPLMFLNNSNDHPHTQNSVNTLADFFNKKPLNIARLKSIVLENYLTIDSCAYEAYKELYIKEKNTPERQSWDIFSDYLDTIDIY